MTAVERVVGGGEFVGGDVADWVEALADGEDNAFGGEEGFFGEFHRVAEGTRRYWGAGMAGQFGLVDGAKLLAAES